MPSSILTAFGASEQVPTVTALQSLANSATAGWGMTAVDNTSDKYLDALINWVIDPANTAPANDKAFYMFGWGTNHSSYYPSTGASSGGTTGSQGALTFPNITTTPILLPLVDTLAYGVADTVIQSVTFSLCKRMGWRRLPRFWGLAVLNYSGAALNSANNRVSWYGSYDTVG